MRSDRYGGSRFAGWAALLGLLLVLPAGAQPGPGRIGVTGVFPTGYVGVLARFGLPREVIQEYQLSDPELVAKFDLLIVGGIPPEVPNVTPAFEKLLERGGSLLVDYSTMPTAMRELLRARQAEARLRRNGKVAVPPAAPPLPSPGAAGMGVGGVSKSEIRLVGPANPLAATLGATATIANPKMSFVPVAPDPQDATVLAQYTATTALPATQDAKERARLLQKADSGPAAPAIVMYRHGRGRVILCGVPLGMATGLQGMDYDQVVLALVRVLSDGRAVPQLEPEGPHLGRKESLRSKSGPADDDADTTTEAAPPEQPAPPPGRLITGFDFVEKQPNDEYTVRGSLPRGRVDVLLDYRDPANHWKVGLDPSGVRIDKVVDGRATQVDGGPVNLPAGTPYAIKVRAEKLLVLAGGSLVSTDLPDQPRGAIAARGGTVEYLPVESAFFKDDFMRTNDSTGGWEIHGGTWQTAPVENPDMGANPFSYKADATGVADATIGNELWDEYRFSAAVRPGADHGEVGLGFYAKDPGNQYQFRIKMRADKPVPEGFQLVKLVDGQAEVLKSADGGLVPNQWYKVMVKAEGPWLGAFVDGVKVLGARDTTYTNGGIDLHLENTSARFDDALVVSVAISPEKTVRIEGRVPDYAGLMDVDSWAGPATPWEPDPDAAGLFWRRNAFYGNLGMKFDVTKLPDGAVAGLVVDGDGQELGSGYAVDLKRTGGQALVSLRHADQVLGQATVPAADLDSLVLRKTDRKLVGLVNDQPVVGTDLPPRQAGGRLAFRALGFKPKVSRLTVWSTNLRDCTFDSAPVDWWVGSGDWDLTNRWSCTPDWSWFGGVSEQTASIWYKQPLSGDMVLDYYAGAKMITDAAGKKTERTGDFNAVLCGDGKSVDSGYAFVTGAEKGGARILRQGKVVAEDTQFRWFARGHNRWANVRVEKHGSRLDLYADGQPLLTYTDPDPLPSGYAGIWTQHNGIMVPRITLSYETAGEPLLSMK